LDIPFHRIAVAVDDDLLYERLRTVLAPHLTPSYRALGMSIVTNKTLRGFGPTSFDLFDLTGVRLARARSREEVERRLLGLLSPLLPDPSRIRTFLDFRVAVRSGQVVLIQAPVADSIRVMRALDRAGWSMVDSMITEVDLHTGRALLRGPLQPQIAQPPVVAEPQIDAVIYAGLGEPSDARLCAALCQRHLQLKDGLDVHDSFDCLVRIAAEATSFVSQDDGEIADWIKHHLAERYSP
jgi:hypothetical protein